MSVNSLKKSIEKEKKRKAKEFKEQVKKFNERKNSNDFHNEQEHDNEIFELYKNMSSAQRAAFDRELEKKKIRDNYALYLKHVYPKYTFTRFHALLCNICQSVVEKIENGQKVRICLSVPPRHGKLIADNEPVLTTKGWKKHGDLVVGDYVYNHLGKSVKVTNVFPKYFANRKITFSNGETILCHENHEWLVYDRFAHKEIVRETKFIEQCVEENNIVGRGHRYRFQLPNKKPLTGEEKDLFVNPYVLGVWLGDGKNNSGTICACDRDRITIDECRKFYPDGAEWKHKTTGVNYAMLIGLCKGLQRYGMCFRKSKDNKFIPQEYLTADINTRLELLAGLLDTDGFLNEKENRYVFTTSDKKLKETFIELVSTFGWRVSIYECKPIVSTSGIVGKHIYWQVCFNPTLSIPCRIPRKQLKIFSMQRKISICKVETIEETQGNCIEVEGGIYLVGKTMLPTHNSMTVTETLPSWFIGRNPDSRCIVTGYNADIAERFGNANRQLIKNFGEDIFGISISDSQDNKTLWDINKHQGGMLATGILGSLTSNGGNLVIVDDPFKNGEEANNPDLREKVYNVFADSVMTRVQGKGNAVIVIHTRWHEDDLIGRLEKLGWIIVNIPCVWEKGIDKMLHRKIGETLCPELGFDAEWAMQIQKTLGPRKWNALYQGKPYIEGGNLLNRSSIKYYEKETLPTTFDSVEMSCDLTFGRTGSNADKVCIGVWGRVGANHYLIKKVKEKMSFQKTLETLRILSSQYPQARKKIVEAKANGLATIQTLNGEIGGFVEFDPGSKSKQERFENVIPLIESGNVYFPCEEIDPNIEDDIEEMLKFPNAKHDDFVDMLSQYLLNYEYKYGGKIDTDSRFVAFARAIRGF